ncbi:MAG: hypothetical protein FJY85_17125 [Deltaproteobacteria bacterium]|nr:hypothetical protein [Deltaproteobacteria bacterium]
MEEMYKGYKIKYNEERSIFEASDGNHHLIDAELKKLRSKIDKQLAHDSGFKPFEAWHYNNASLQRVRVTSVKQEPVRPYAEPEKYMVRITYLDKNDEDGYNWQRNEVYHDTILALDPTTAKKAEELKALVDQRKELKKAIEDMAEGLPRIRPSDLGITEEAKR